MTEHLTDLQNSVKKQKQQAQKRNDTSAQTNNNDGEHLGKKASTETNNTRNSGANMPIEPNSVKNNLSDKNIESFYYDFLITKEGNRDGSTERQYQDAKPAWKLYLNTGGGGIDNFKHYLRQNIIQNSPVTNNVIN